MRRCPIRAEIEIILQRQPDITNGELSAMFNIPKVRVESIKARIKISKKVESKAVINPDFGDIRDEPASNGIYEGGEIMDVKQIARELGYTEYQTRYLLKSAMSKCRVYFEQLGVSSFNDERVIG